MTLDPPGPFPPVGPRGPGLPWRLVDAVLDPGQLTGVVRATLAERLHAAVREQAWAEAAGLLDAVLDTWPLAALLPEALGRWTEGRGDADDLDVLARCAALVGLARGWAPFAEGPWPLPDAQTLRAWLPGAEAVAARAPGDGAPALAEALGLPLRDEDAGLPLAAAGDHDVAARRDALVTELLAGRALALRWEGPEPSSAEAALARGELRMEAPRQASFDRYGLAGLRVPEPGRWTRRLLPPAPGHPGGVLRPVVTWALLPGTPGSLAEGRVAPVCALFLPGPRRPALVVPVAAPLLASLEGAGPPPPLPEEETEALLEGLRALGAVSAA